MKPFDIIEDISFTKEDLMSSDREACTKAYNPWLTNRHFSYHVDSLMLSNDMNVLHHLDPDMQYTVLFSEIRSKKRFSKWHKPSDVEVVSALSYWYGINNTRARELLRVLKPEEVQTITERLGSGEDEGAGRPRRDKTKGS